MGGELPGYAPLAQLLAAAQSLSANVIGAPYRDAVAALNEAVNPIVAFNRIEGPIALQFNNLTNGLGIPRIAQPDSRRDTGAGHRVGRAQHPDPSGGQHARAHRRNREAVA